MYHLLSTLVAALLNDDAFFEKPLLTALATDEPACVALADAPLNELSNAFTPESPIVFICFENEDKPLVSTFDIWFEKSDNADAKLFKLLPESFPISAENETNERQHEIMLFIFFMLMPSDIVEDTDCNEPAIPVKSVLIAKFNFERLSNLASLHRC